MFTAFLSFMGGNVFAASVTVHKSTAGWVLDVDGSPYFVKGVNYTPTPAGQDPNGETWRDWSTTDEDGDGRIDAPYESWVDRNHNGRQDADEPRVGDFRLLQQMGCNTIRIYHHSFAGKNVPPTSINKKLLNDLFNTFGIRVAMGDLLGAYTVGSGAAWESGTDYRDPVQRARMLASVKTMVETHKDEPYLLFWILGNENEFGDLTHTNAGTHPDAYLSFLKEVCHQIHQWDPHHPVSVAAGETGLLPQFARSVIEIDIFGLNSYRDGGFGDLWDAVSRVYDKPVLLTEFGVGYPPVTQGILDEDVQANRHRQAYCDMAAHAAGGKYPGNSIGGFVFEFLDEWWMDGKPFEHNLGTNGRHNEWHGLIAQGEPGQSPLLRWPRLSYFLYKNLWTGQEACTP